MSAWIAIVLTCWCCVLIAVPRKPLPGNEVAELVYMRLLGRHERLVLLAMSVTTLAFLALVVTGASRADDASAFVPEPQRVCRDGSAVLLTCYVPQPSGMWMRDELQPNGTWQHVGTVATPPAQSG